MVPGSQWGQMSGTVAVCQCRLSPTGVRTPPGLLKPRPGVRGGAGPGWSLSLRQPSLSLQRLGPLQGEDELGPAPAQGGQSPPAVWLPVRDLPPTRRPHKRVLKRTSASSLTDVGAEILPGEGHGTEMAELGPGARVSDTRACSLADPVWPPSAKTPRAGPPRGRAVPSTLHRLCGGTG